jgi:leucyl-tRNA synthetase
MLSLLKDFLKGLVFDQKFIGILAPRIPTMMERKWKDEIVEIKSQQKVKMKSIPEIDKSSIKRPPIEVDVKENVEVKKRERSPEKMDEKEIKKVKEDVFVPIVPKITTLKEDLAQKIQNKYQDCQDTETKQKVNNTTLISRLMILSESIALESSLPSNKYIKLHVFLL